ncbi:MAG: LON peptidase substrate-binding domain-containing protein [Myxococcales bacterium]|nr:LON peptidase substrate-binding domain-containing protein [Myxococcales bacterium]
MDAPPDLIAALPCLPLFPLPEVVLLPGARLPLHVFEPRYRVMLERCMATHRALAVVQLLRGTDAQGLPRLARLAGGGIITEHHALADGRANILVEGLARLELEELAFEPPYRRARATVLPDAPGQLAEPDRRALLSAATTFARLVRGHDRSFSFHVDPAEPRLVELCAFQLVVDAELRQSLLEEPSLAVRAQKVTEALMVQAATLGQQSGAGRDVN